MMEVGLETPSGHGFWTPEQHLRLTASVPPGVSITNQDVGRFVDAVFAVDFAGLDGSTGGIIAEFGGSGNGSYCGFEADGTFIMRAGSGGSLSAAGCHFLQLAPGVLAGNGTLVVSIQLNVARAVRLWWNGQQIGQQTDDRNPLTSWAGDDWGSYLKPTGTGSLPGGHFNASLPTYDAVSDLRYYLDQVV